MTSTNYKLTTYRDAIEHVVDVFTGQDAEPRTWRNARRAVDEAYTQMAGKRNWRYYQRTYQLLTEDAYSTGTIEYDHAGGTYERMVTLTDGTFPTNARYFSLLLGRLRYDVEDRKSDTVLTLTENSNPGSDLSATSFTLYRDSYPLPDDFYRMGRLVDTLCGARAIRQVTADQLLVHNRGLLTTQLPWVYAVTPSLHYAGGVAIQFAPSPTVARNYDAIYRGRGLPFKVEKAYDGTVTTVAGSAAVVGSADTDFSQDMVGAILRVSSDTGLLPTGPMGNIEASEEDNHYAEQYVIKSVTDARHLTLETVPVTGYTDTKYTISSRLDVEAGSMLTYFLRLCEAFFARIEGRKDRTEREAWAEQALIDAAGDNNSQMSDDDPYDGPMRLSDIATSVNFD
jgi:hypothetical protein